MRRERGTVGVRCPTIRDWRCTSSRWGKLYRYAGWHYFCCLPCCLIFWFPLHCKRFIQSFILHLLRGCLLLLGWQIFVERNVTSDCNAFGPWIIKKVTQRFFIITEKMPLFCTKTILFTLCCQNSWLVQIIVWAVLVVILILNCDSTTEANYLHSSFHLRVHIIKDYGCAIIIRPALLRTGRMSCSFFSHLTYVRLHAFCLWHPRTLARMKRTPTCNRQDLFANRIRPQSRRQAPLFSPGPASRFSKYRLVNWLCWRLLRSRRAPFHFDFNRSILFSREAQIACCKWCDEVCCSQSARYRRRCYLHK